MLAGELAPAVINYPAWAQARTTPPRGESESDDVGRKIR